MTNRDLVDDTSQRAEEHDEETSVTSVPSDADGKARLVRMGQGVAIGIGSAGLAAAIAFLAASSGGRGVSAAAPAPPQDNPHATRAALSPAAEERVADLERRLQQDASDLTSRKELAVLLLDQEAWVAAYNHAEEILATAPDDPDGLYVHGVVRLQMGQTEQALQLLDQVLLEYPDHTRALHAAGIAHLRLGRSDQAVQLWERGLAAAGGRHEEFERLLAVSRSAKQGAGLEQAAGDSEVLYRVRVALSAGAAARDLPARGTLFLTLRSREGAPPVAVKRVFPATFPVDLALSAADSMFGEPLPEGGIVEARLDEDGNASTHSDGDLAGRATMRSGGSTELQLR